MIGGVIMVHGDDDGLRVPPLIAPWQVVIVPMLRDVPEDEAIIAYCRDLRDALGKQSAFGELVRALLDLKPAKATTKRWGWIKKGAPIVVEVGGRDMAGGAVSVIRRDRLYRADGKLDSRVIARDAFAADVPAMLAAIQTALHAEATGRLKANITAGRRLGGRRGTVRGQSRQSRLGRCPLVKADGCRAGHGRRPVEGAEAHDPQRADGARWDRGCVHLYRRARGGAGARRPVLLTARQAAASHASAARRSSNTAKRSLEAATRRACRTAIRPLLYSATRRDL